MTALEMNRRRFLRTTSLVAVGAAATAVATIAAVSNGAFALSTTTLSEHEARTLLRMARHLFPHDELGDRYYMLAVEALDEQAEENPELARELAEGIRALDQARGIEFLSLSPGNQQKVLEEIQDTSFFATVRGATVGSLYANDTIARHFGYEGSSVEYGGYLERGFDDLGWLPKLPNQPGA